jgi:hypothetical protein
MQQKHSLSVGCIHGCPTHCWWFMGASPVPYEPRWLVYRFHYSFLPHFPSLCRCRGVCLTPAFTWVSLGPSVMVPCYPKVRATAGKWESSGAVMDMAGGGGGCRDSGKAQGQGASRPHRGQETRATPTSGICTAEPSGAASLRMVVPGVKRWLFPARGPATTLLLCGLASSTPPHCTLPYDA